MNEQQLMMMFSLMPPGMMDQIPSLPPAFVPGQPMYTSGQYPTTGKPRREMPHFWAQGTGQRRPQRRRDMLYGLGQMQFPFGSQPGQTRPSGY
jgi:hypothetical protein